MSENEKKEQEPVSIWETTISKTPIKKKKAEKEVKFTKVNLNFKK